MGTSKKLQTIMTLELVEFEKQKDFLRQHEDAWDIWERRSDMTTC